jgi:hypothetical protein
MGTIRDRFDDARCEGQAFGENDEVYYDLFCFGGEA